MNNRRGRRTACIALQFCALALTAPPAQTFTTLAGFNGTNGFFPLGSLIQATDGQLYGTTSSGGADGSGTIFSFAMDGKPTVLYSFSATYDGSGSEGGLIQATDGNFYGTTYSAGTNGTGTVFQFATGGAFVTLHNFSSTIEGENPDGANPIAPLIQGASGILYGTASQGGPAGGGTVFIVAPDGTFATLLNFGSSSKGFYAHRCLGAGRQRYVLRGNVSWWGPDERLGHGLQYDAGRRPDNPA